MRTRWILRLARSRLTSMVYVLKRSSVLPGFNLTLGYTLFYLALIVLIPISALFLKTATLAWRAFWSHSA